MAFNDYKLKVDIVADSDSAQRAVKSLYGDINKLGGGFTSAFGGAVPVAAAAAAGIAVVATATVAAASAVFSLTKAASEYGSEIFDATQQTGLSAETMSALKVAADQSGSSLENITGSVAKFNVLIGQANQGNEKANATLARYGITARDTDTALAQSIKTIAEMTSVDQQAAAAKDLFKDRTAAILPVIKSFDGDLPALMDKLRALGLLLSDEDARAADEFGDTLDTVTAQAAGVGRQFAFELMPLITDAMTAVSGVMAENKGVAREWGQEVIYTVNGVKIVATGLAAPFILVTDAMNLALGTNADAWKIWGRVVTDTVRAVLAATTFGISEIVFGLNWLGEKLDSGQVRGGIGGNFRAVDLPSIENAGGARAGTRSKSGRSSAASEAAQRAARDLSAQLGIENINLQTIQEQLRETFENIRQEFRNTDDAEKFFQSSTEGMTRYQSALLTSLHLIEELERRQLKADASENERAFLRAQQQERRNRIVKIGKDEYEKNNKELEAADDRRSKNAEERFESELNWTKRLMDAERERLELLKQFPTPPSVFESPESFGIDTTAGITGVADLNTKGQEMAEQSSQWLANLPLDTLNAFAQGIGSVVENLVLMGDAGEKAFQRLTATILAQVAAQSAVLAIKHLAFGFAALTPWGAVEYGPAAMQFKAAALFGSIAVGAGLAGRAVAGDTFKQGGGSSAGGYSGGGSGASQLPPSPISRQSDYAFVSGRRSHEMAVATAVEKLNSKIDSMSPGDVLRAASKQNPGFFARQTAAEVRSDYASARSILKSGGVT